MYQLELAGLKIFHKLYFPERSPSFLSPKTLFLFIVQCHHFVFPKTTYEDKPTIYTHHKKECGENKREWDVWSQCGSRKRKRPFPPRSHSLYFVPSCGRETSALYQKVKSRKTKKKTEAEKTKGEGEERHKKNKKCIKSWGRQEAAHGLKCMEINIKLSLAPLLAANKGPASSPCLHGL